MSEEERLNIVSSVKDDFSDELSTLQTELENVDEQIRKTGGGGDDEIEVDVHLKDETIADEVAALNAQLEAIDDEIEIDVTTNFDSLLRDDLTFDGRLIGSKIRSTETGRPVSTDSDVLDRGIRDLFDVMDDTMQVSDVDIDAGNVEIDAATADTGTTSKSLATSGGRPTLGDPDDLVTSDRELSRDDLFELLRMRAGSQDFFKFTTSEFGDDHAGGGLLGRTSGTIPATGVAIPDADTDLVDPRLLRQFEPSDDNDVNFEGPFGSGRGAASGSEVRDLMGILGFEDALSRADASDFDALDRLMAETEPDVTNEDLRETFGVDKQTVEEAMDQPDAVSRSRPGILETLRGDDDTLMNFRRAVSRAKSNIDEFDIDLDDFRFTMRKYHNVIASLIPLAAIFAGALPAAITGVAALGAAALGAAGALGGIGVLGFMGISLEQTGGIESQPINQELQRVSDAFVEAFAPLATTFAPLIREMLSDIEMMMGPLATASSGLLAFRDNFRSLTDFITMNLPSAVSGFLAFTNAIMPLLEGLIRFVADQNILGFLAQQLAKALPALRGIGEAIASLLPRLVQFSQIFLVLSEVILSAVGVFFMLMDAAGPLGKALVTLIGAFIALSTVISVFNVLTKGASGIITGKIIPAIAGWIVKNTALTASLWQAKIAAAALLATLSAGLYVVAGELIGRFATMGGQIGKARKELERFARTDNSFGSVGSSIGRSGPAGGSAVYQDNSTTVINAGDPDDAARQQYSNQFERREHVNSVFGGGA